MPRLSQRFNATEYNHDTSPPQRIEWFRVKILESNMRAFENGEMLNFDFEVVKGRETGDRYRKRVWRCGLWWDHESPKAVGWGRTLLAKLAMACGQQEFEDSDELNGCELMALIGPQRNNPKYPSVSDFSALPVEKPSDHEHYVPDRHDHKDGADDYEDEEIPF